VVRLRSEGRCEAEGCHRATIRPLFTLTTISKSPEHGIECRRSWRCSTDNDQFSLEFRAKHSGPREETTGGSVMSDDTLVDAAKAPTLAYNDKDWDAVNQAVTSDFSYDEVATHRNVRGVADFISASKGWAAAFPDSRATFEAAYVSGNTVILELTWRGTHSGPLQMPTGEIPATGRTIEMRACQVVDIADGKARGTRQYFDMATMMTQLGVNAVGA
jgi:steroid delta-isomerase-like uncharacterized protein